MADHPLRPATHRRLGGPLPRQLANGTRAHRKAEAYAEASFPPCGAHAVLATVSSRYSSLPGRYPRVTHPCATLLRPKPFHVRLACVRHAASVQSEPESNSPVEKYLIQRNICFSNRTQSSIFPTRYSLVKEPPPLISGEDALCIICFFLSTTFFKVFSERRFSTPLLPAPWGFLRAAVPQRVRGYA